MDEKGRYTALPPVNLPERDILGTVGAGDAFLSGLLYGALRGVRHERATRTAAAAAAFSLLGKDSGSAIPRYDSLEEVYRRYPQQNNW